MTKLLCRCVSQFSDLAQLQNQPDNTMTSHLEKTHELIARGIFIQDGAVLVNRSRNAKTGEDYCALPGGHVDKGESCPFALSRECEEELGCGASIGDLVFVSESIYAGRHENDSRRHEIVLYFSGELSSQLEMQNGRIVSPEADKNFGWLPLDKLASANLLPFSIKEHLLKTIAATPPITSTRYYDFNDATAN
jgi:8-oxo-dGTP pyrophosphatase MutT (NUDIX family)